MKKVVIVGSAVIFVLIIFALFYFFIFKDDYEPKEITAYGNSNGNIANSGIVAENDKYIFISSVSGKSSGIFRKSKDDGKTVKICEDRAIYLNFYDDELYYVNLDDKGTIYKIDDDGSNKEKQADYEGCEYLTVTDKGSFFEYGESGNVYSPYKSDNDFKDILKLNDDDIETLVYDNGFLYFSNWNDGGKIYKMKTDGSEKTSLNNSYSGLLNIYDGWIYYNNYDDNYKIYRVKTDGSENMAVCEDSVRYFNCFDGYIYYSNENDENKIYKIGVNGEGKSKISDSAGSIIFIADGKVLFMKDTDENLYSVNTDGSDEKIVIEGY